LLFTSCQTSQLHLGTTATTISQEDSGVEGVSQDHSYQNVGYVVGGTGIDVLTLLGVATDIYSKLSYDDTDCQKKIICEFMQEPDMFGKPRLIKLLRLFLFL
jgi:hypothetical protein